MCGSLPSTLECDDGGMKQEPLSKRTLAISLLVAGALFMENLDSTILATGLPAMAATFRVHVVDVNVGVTAYLLALAIFIPISGWMADRWGTRLVFSSAITVFTLASAWCGASHSLPEFAAARVLQGLGGSMMVPVGRLMTVREVPKHHIMRTMAYTIWPALIAPIMGPATGGWIILHFNWRWMFLLNVPIGVVLLLGTLLLVHDRQRHTPPPFDWLGFVLIGATCFSAIDLMETASVQPPQWVRMAIMLVLLVGCSSGAWVHLHRSRTPLFSPELLRIPTYRVVVLGGSWISTAIFMTPFILPLMFQVGFGMNAFAAGSLVVAVFVGNLAMKPLTTPLLRRYGFKRVLAVNGVMTAFAFFACVALTPATSRWMILLVLFLGGLGRSMQLTALTTLGFAELDPQQMSSGSALFAMVRQLNMSLGVGIAAVSLRLAGWLHGEPGRLGPYEFHAAFIVVGLLALASLPSALSLPHGAGDVVAGKHTPTAETLEPLEG